jgi:uncharacterized protein YndB with AHSA1/START domain
VIPHRGSAEALVAAPPEAVWEVLADVTRTGEWSHECRGAQWVGVPGAVPGARFRGRNEAGLVRWSRPCVIETAVPGRELSWRTQGPWPTRDSARWRITLAPRAGGTEVRQTFEVLNLPDWFARVIERMIPAHRDRSAALAADLRRLGEVAGRLSGSRSQGASGGSPH